MSESTPDIDRLRNDHSPIDPDSISTVSLEPDVRTAHTGESTRFHLPMPIGEGEWARIEMMGKVERYGLLRAPEAMWMGNAPPPPSSMASVLPQSMIIEFATTGGLVAQVISRNAVYGITAISRAEVAEHYGRKDYTVTGRLLQRIVEGAVALRAGETFDAPPAMRAAAEALVVEMEAGLPGKWDAVPEVWIDLAYRCANDRVEQPDWRIAWMRGPSRLVEAICAADKEEAERRRSAWGKGGLSTDEADDADGPDDNDPIEW